MNTFELVIAGAGLTAARAVKSYREAGGGGRIALVSEETTLPSHRPAPSKKYLRGEKTEAPLVEDEAFYADHDVEVLLDTAVTSIDAGNRFVMTDGSPLHLQGERWERLAARGATKQRCLWASTSTKDPSLRDTLYVEELIGPETISTMPEETIRAFQDHGRVDLTLESGLEEAQHLFNQLYAAGVDYEDVVRTLEREGVEKFIVSFDELLRGVAEKRERLTAAA